MLYMDGRFRDQDSAPRALFILGRFGSIREEIASSWWHNAAARLNEYAGQADASASRILEMARIEDFGGNTEIADQLDQLSQLSTDELRRQLLDMASHLDGSRRHLN
jgi:predicted component of type VI protein secretion system